MQARHGADMLIGRRTLAMVGDRCADDTGVACRIDHGHPNLDASVVIAKGHHVTTPFRQALHVLRVARRVPPDAHVGRRTRPVPPVFSRSARRSAATGTTWAD